MLYINHRINSLAQLAEVPLQNGVEIDIRYHEDSLVLHHDPFGHHREPKPCLLEGYLKVYKNEGPLIANVKTEGVEELCIQLFNQYAVKNWFFLDLSMPYFAIYAEKAAQGVMNGFGPENLAVRFSEREPIEYALSFAGKVQWVWVDCFTKLPLNKKNAEILKDAGFNICLVSPELQKHSLERINEFKQQLEGTAIDAVCTKRPDLWGQV